MSSLTDINLGIAKKLRDKGYFQRFFRRRAQGEIASQIRELRDRRGFTQSRLANKMKTGQSAIARIENAKYSGWSFLTLLSVADILEARLRIVFEPMEDVIQNYENREKATADREEFDEVITGFEDDGPTQNGILKEYAPVDSFAKRIQNHSTPKKNPAYPHLEIEKPMGATFENLETPSQ